MSNREEQMAAIDKDLARQDEELARVMEQIAALGDVELAIPDEVFEQLDEACTVRASHVMGMFAIRG